EGNRRPSRLLQLDTLEDRLALSVTAAINLVDPSAALVEGSAVALDSTVDGATAPTYAWSVTRNGSSFTLPTGTATDASTFNFTPTDNGSSEVSLTVTDGADSVTAIDTLTVVNVPPTASVTGPSVGVRGQTLSFSLGATDPSSEDQAVGFTYNVD